MYKVLIQNGYMIKKIFLFKLFFGITICAFCQFSKEKMDSINNLNKQDHQLMMKLLGISELRPGPSGNPKDTNAANSDEFKSKSLYKFARSINF